MSYFSSHKLTYFNKYIYLFQVTVNAPVQLTLDRNFTDTLNNVSSPQRVALEQETAGRVCIYVLYITQNRLKFMGVIKAVADPEFPVRGAWTRWGGGVWTFDAGAFHGKCMQKRKNVVP